MDYGALIHGVITAWFGCLAYFTFRTKFNLISLFSLWWVAGFFGGREAGQHEDFPFTLHQISEWAPSQFIALGITLWLLYKAFYEEEQI